MLYEIDSLLNLEILCEILGCDLALYILYIDLVAFRNAVVLSVDLLIGNLDVLKLCDLFESKTEFDLTLCLRLHLLADRVKGHSGVLEIGCKIESLHTESRVIVADEVLGFRIEHYGGNVRIELLDESCGELLVNCAVRLSGLCLFKFRLYIGGIFSNGVEFGNVTHEFIVKLGLLVELDGVEFALEGAVLACERLLVIICREGNIYVELVADRVTDDLLLKSGDE